MTVTVTLVFFPFTKKLVKELFAIALGVLVMVVLREGDVSGEGSSRAERDGYAKV